MAGICTRCRGFSLIELAIIMMIMGLIIGGVAETLRVERKIAARENTMAALGTLHKAITRYQSDHQRHYPCPANPNLPVTDPKFGAADCQTVDAVACTPTTGICSVDGRVIDGTAGKVYIGVMPFKYPWVDSAGVIQYSPLKLESPLKSGDTTIGMSDILDGWGNLITYAVSADMTENSIKEYSPDNGAISVVASDQITSLVDPPGSAHFVLVSHGKDGKGAFSSQGVLRSPCTANPGLDVENCNKDDKFLTTSMSSATEVKGANYYDDFVDYWRNTQTELWASTGPLNTIIYNKNQGGFVGINTLDPQQRLDVGGGLRATQVNTPVLCDQSGTNCFDQRLIGGDCDATDVYCGLTPDPDNPGKYLPVKAPAIRCPAGQAISGIDHFSVYIADPLAPPHTPACENMPVASVIPKTCPSGPPQQYVVGVDSGGNVICQ